MGVRRRGAERASARVPWLPLSFREGRRAREARDLDLERSRLLQLRQAIARKSGRIDDDAEPTPRLHNFAAQLANAERQLAAARR